MLDLDLCDYLLTYQYEVYAIGDDIQVHVSYVSIHLHLETLSQLSLRVDVIHHYFFDS